MQESKFKGGVLLFIVIIGVVMLSGCIAQTSSDGTSVDIPGVKVSVNKDGSGTMVDVNAGNSKISVNKTGNGSQVGVSGDGSNIAVNTVNEGNSSVNVSAGQGGQVGVTTGSSNANVAVSIGGSIVKPAYCGDKTCQSGENCFLCSGDCGNCKEEMVVVSGVRVTQEIRSSERINVLVSGVENKVTIKKGTDVKYLLVGGVENDVFVEEGVALENVWVTGVRVKLHLPEGLEANIQTSGTQAETIRD